MDAESSPSAHIQPTDSAAKRMRPTRLRGRRTTTEKGYIAVLNGTAARRCLNVVVKVT
ncbi:hypothetical protein ABIC16_002566 [Sphingomonas sp. PvP055]